MRKKLIIIGFGLLVFIIAGAVLSRHSEKAARPAAQLRGTNVIAFGDSLVKGIGASEGKDWVSLASTAIGEPIINAGRNGDTTSSALPRLDRDVLQHDPKLVIVLLGGNDYLQRIPEQETFENIRKIIDAIQGTGSQVILVSFDGGFISSYTKGYRQVAEEKDVAFVPSVLDGLIGNSSLMSDPIHPNDAGYQKVAERITPVVKKVLGK